MPNPRPTKAFEAINNYLGWGDPERGCWFIGTEEATGWEGYTENKVICHYKEGEEFTPAEAVGREWGAEGSRIRKMMSTIARPISRKGRVLTVEDFTKDVLWYVGSKLFQVNLFPIGKSSENSWSDEYQKLFGFSNFNQYYKYVAENTTRHKRIRELWEFYQPQATICFGKSKWEYCKNIFDPKLEPEEIVEEKIYAYNDIHMILTQHFSWPQHFDERDARLVANKLVEWGVQLP